MADKKEEESKIPVFTVIKNGAILKNIFLINNPPSPPSVGNEETPDQEILIVGRHPDCHVMLTHPSISRFHLQIQSNPSSLKLSVIDLSSGNCLIFAFVTAFLSSYGSFPVGMVCQVMFFFFFWLVLDFFIKFVGFLQCTGHGFRRKRLNLEFLWRWMKVIH